MSSSALAALRSKDRGPLICDVLTAGTPQGKERLRAALHELREAERILAIISAVATAKKREDPELEARVYALHGEA